MSHIMSLPDIMLKFEFLELVIPEIASPTTTPHSLSLIK